MPVINIYHNKKKRIKHIIICSLFLIGSFFGLFNEEEMLVSILTIILFFPTLLFYALPLLRNKPAITVNEYCIYNHSSKFDPLPWYQINKFCQSGDFINFPTIFIDVFDKYLPINKMTKHEINGLYADGFEDGPLPFHPYKLDLEWMDVDAEKLFSLLVKMKISTPNERNLLIEEYLSISNNK